MSILLMARRRRRKTTDGKAKQRAIRKAGFCLYDSKAKPLLTKAWEVSIDGSNCRVSFSRDNLHVWINGEPVEVTAYISDQGMDVDLYFDVTTHKGHIFSDVEGSEMTNTLYMDDDIVAQHQFSEKN
ncbi:uncharacterized protein LOC135479158 isoform X2 [Liolophura sinensis]|uniref:uncharacterized protein LOC135479158 isoform X2 n=1 Tax=Liolophura sinensis TaxID=3198878 RepID=UPI003158F0EF